MARTLGDMHIPVATKLEIAKLRPPVDVLFDWMKRKGVAGDMEDAERLSTAIAIEAYKRKA